MIRSLHIIDHLGLGGAQAVLLDLARNLPSAGVIAEVAALHGEGPFFDALQASGISVRSLSPAKWPPRFIPRLAELASSGEYDVAHFHLQASNWLAKPIFAALGNRPLIAHDHSSGNLKFRGIRSLLPDAFFHGFSSKIIAVSGGVRDFLARFEGIDPDLISVIPNGADTGLFRPPSPEKRARARARYGLETGDFAVGAVGRLSPEKNYAILPEVAAAVPGSVFLLAGDGPLRAELEAACAASGVKLIGTISERPSFYAALDAFVIPSLYEGLPMVLLEAMACGLPIVSSALPDIAEALGACGFLADPARPATFAAALEKIRSRPDEATRLGREARARCEGGHSARSMAEKTAALYRELLP